MSESMSDAPEPSAPLIPDAMDNQLDVGMLGVTSLTREQLRLMSLQRLREVRSELADVRQQLLVSQNECIASKRMTESMTLQHSEVVNQLMESIEINRINSIRYDEEVNRLNSRITHLLNDQQEEKTINENDESATPSHSPEIPRSIAAQAVTPAQFIKPAAPDKFNGTDRSVSIEVFLNSAERFLRLSKVDKKDKIDQTVMYFSGIAYEWWISIETTEGEEIRNIEWDVFKQMCLKRFMPVTSAESAYKRIGRCRQKGDISTYISGFQNLAQQIPFSLLSKEARVLQFVDGLNFDLQKVVKSMRPANIEDAINFAQSIGSIGYKQIGMNYNNRDYQTGTNRQPQPTFRHYNSGTRNQPIELENVTTVETQEDNFNESIDNLTIDLSFLTTEQRQLYKEGKCFNCKKTGHRGRDCPLSNNSRSFNQKSFNQKKREPRTVN